MTKKSGQQKSSKIEKEVEGKDKNVEDETEEVNSGFGNYLTSSTGLYGNKFNV